MSESRPLQLAVIATVFYPYSHADVIVSRWLSPWPDDARVGWTPHTQIASLFVAQTPPNDIRVIPELLEWFENRALPWGVRRAFDVSHYTSEKYGLALSTSIRDALCLGGETLAVDGVLLIGEHGDYAFNEYGQKLYPRKEMWDEIIAVFESSGRVVPVFNDKGLSWNPEWAHEMVETARHRNIPFMAGSSLTLNGFAPHYHGTEPPLGSHLENLVFTFGAGPESYGFHSLEWAQSLLEKYTPARETSCRALGVEALEVWQGDAVWNALDTGELPNDLWLLALEQLGKSEANIREACDEVNRSESVQRGEPGAFRTPVVFRVFHQNGTRSHHFYLPGPGIRFVLALRYRDPQGVQKRFAAANLADDASDALLGHFARLNIEIEKLMCSHRGSVPIERTLLSTLTIATVMRTLAHPAAHGKCIPTPELKLTY